MIEYCDKKPSSLVGADSLLSLAGITPTDDEREILANNIYDVAAETNYSSREATFILLQRIGGIENLRAHLNALMASGQRKDE